MSIPYRNSLQLSAEAKALLSKFDQRVENVLSDVLESSVWETITSAETETEEIYAFLREVMLSIHWYQGLTTEAGFHMLGRLPKDSGRIMTTLLAHKADEAEHGLWALRDYLLLGGTQEIADSHASPATFAVAGVWWWMAQRENPLGYLGAEYLFEYLTARIAPLLMEQLKRHQIDTSKIGFLRDHVEEDIAHTQLLRATVGRAIEQYPDCEAAMVRCFDYFHQVYPLPVWTEALLRSREPLGDR